MLGQTTTQLVAATNPGTGVTVHQYEDFASLGDSSGYYSSAQVAFLRQRPRSPLPTPEGGQTQNINAYELDPALRVSDSKFRQAQREANEAMGRRQKAMEDAARAAAAAFDAGIEAENNPVKLDSNRKLKAI